MTPTRSWGEMGVDLLPPWAKSIPHESEKAVGDDGRKEGKKIMRVSGFSQHANSAKKKGAG